MPTLTMTDLIPKDFLTPLTLFGQFDWLTWQNSTPQPSSTAFRLALANVPALYRHKHFIDELGSGRVPPNILLGLYAQSKLLADGPKLLRPTEEQCEALEFVDAQLAIDEYVQPFPAVLVEFPDCYRRHVANRFGRKCPIAVLGYHDSQQRFIVASCIYQPGNSHGMAMSYSPPSTGTIEDRLRCLTENKDVEAQLHTSLLRVAINLCLLLTRYGVKNVGPLDPMRHRKLRRNARKSNQRKADRAKELLDATINLIAFEQEVVFCNAPPEVEGNPDADGRKKRPHWRRGHIRMQAIGAGHAERRLVVIHPCFINRRYFRGDVADTTYRISVPRTKNDFTPNAC